MIKYLTGNVLDSDAAVILHQVNCKGKMGAGLALQVRNRYPFVYKQYTAFCSNVEHSSSLLGETLIVPINSEQCIANLFAQDGYAHYGFAASCLTDYNALRRCLKVINRKYKGKKVALPYLLGCGLAGGDWNVVKKIIEEELKDCNVEIFSLK